MSNAISSWEFFRNTGRPNQQTLDPLQHQGEAELASSALAKSGETSQSMVSPYRAADMCAGDRLDGRANVGCICKNGAKVPQNWSNIGFFESSDTCTPILT